MIDWRHIRARKTSNERPDDWPADVRAFSQEGTAKGLPADELHKVTAEHIWKAVQALRDNPEQHRFGPSTDFDLITNSGDRLPPKAVFGLAASEALGFDVQPKHFTGGLGTVCFKLLEDAGYDIVPKGTNAYNIEVPISDKDQRWTEGRPRLVSHLRRERASGLAQAKRDSFKRQHGQLRCERCGLDPVSAYGGLHGEACIEVHHSAIHVEDMGGTHVTRLEDLQCLCANCYRVVHRLLKQSLAFLRAGRWQNAAARTDRVTLQEICRQIRQQLNR